MSRTISRRRAALCGVVLWAVVGSACATPVLSVEDEKEIGDKIAAEALKEPKIIRDHLVRGYIEDLGARIVDASGPQPFDYTFYVLDDPNINAFASPGGHVFVHTGLILAADNVSELAGVMGHEVGHVALRHVARSYYRNRGTGILATVLGVGLDLFVGYGASMVTDLLALSYVNAYSRDYEREADLFAVEILPIAGIHPIGLATFFETMMREGGPNPPPFLSSHPAHEERIENARQAIAERDIGGNLDMDDDGRLEIIQRRIHLLTGR